MIKNRAGKNSTHPANGGKKFRHDAGLERGVGVMNEKALHYTNNKRDR
jgi:hypothetical protein